MALYILENCKLYLDGYNISGDLNQMELSSELEAKDSTVFGDTTSHSQPGLMKNVLNHQGFWQADNSSYKVDDILNSKHGVRDVITSVCPTTGAAGEPAFTMQSLQASFSHPAKIGEIYAFSVSAKGTGTLVRGTVMENGAKTITGTGTARQLGTVGASQYLYAVMHVIAVSGTNPTLDMVIQSDNAGGFASPVNRITFAQATAIGAQWATRVAGSITDDWWRCSYTIGGTNPSFSVVVVVGIQ